ncbi:MFS transporter [Breoghania sp.]|uniref:MFS transporter n=1 Tax=Breoghania sp. TaxID=2065378 RepID=UPI00261149C8|nr:MFS transporter [Breoghania sp.]MDJ0933663.1 MFS transporter [Breoghania sp.]
MVSPLKGRSRTFRLYYLSIILFVSYLCVAMSLPVVPLEVSGTLGMSNAWAGFAVGIVFLATILSRGRAGIFADQGGAKRVAMIGLGCYAGGALVSLVVGLLSATPELSFWVLVAGRLVIGLGENFVGVALNTWGIEITGPEQSGRVMAFVGAALYGGFAAGGPLGIALFDHWGFAGTMAVAAVLPIIGIGGLMLLPGVAGKTAAEQPSFWKVLDTIKTHGAIVGLQGIGFAAIGAFFSLFFHDQDWVGAGFGLTAFGVGFVLVRILFGGLPDRIGSLRVAIVSLIVEMVGQCLIWFSPEPAFAFVGAFMTGLGCSPVFPGVGREVVRIVPPHLRGTALGGRILGVSGSCLRSYRAGRRSACGPYGLQERFPDGLDCGGARRACRGGTSALPSACLCLSLERVPDA